MWNNSFSPQPPVVREALSEAVSFLKRRGIPQPRLEAEVLLAALLGEERVKLITHDRRLLPPSLWKEYQELLRKRGEGWPLQYLTGRQEFMSLSFKVNPAVLIPRADTEVLVEKVLSYKETGTGSQIKHIVDVGTGSGAIAVSLAYYWPEVKVTGVDVSPEALAVARENAAIHGVEVEWIRGDLLTPLINARRKVQLVVSNPPYIPAGDLPSLSREVRKEPALALNGGPDGLDYYRCLAAQAPSCLEAPGLIALEIGWDQGEAVRELLERAGFTGIEIGRDYAARDRVVTAVWRP